MTDAPPDFATRMGGRWGYEWDARKDPERAAAELESLFGFDPESIMLTSGRTGLGARAVLDAVVTRLPPPRGKKSDSFRALVFDAHNDDAYRGVVCLVALAGGSAIVGAIALIGGVASLGQTAASVPVIVPNLSSFAAEHASMSGAVSPGGTVSVGSLRGVEVQSAALQVDDQASEPAAP